MKKQVLGFGCWVLGVYSEYFFMIRCGWWLQPCLFYMKKKVLGFGYWVLGFASNCFFDLRCVHQGMGVYMKR